MGWNRKDWLKLAGLLGLGATGAGLAGVGPLAGMLASGNTAAAGGGLAAATIGDGAIPMAAMGGDTAIKASQAMTPLGKAMGGLSSAASTTGKVGGALGAANTAMGLLGGGEQPQPVAPPPPNQFQPTPVQNPYGMDQPPPGIDPRQWAMMSPEQKRMMMMGRG